MSSGFLSDTELLSQVNCGAQWLEALSPNSPEVRCQLNHSSCLYTVSFLSLQARGSVGCSIPSLVPSFNLPSILVEGTLPPGIPATVCGLAKVNRGWRNCLAGRTKPRVEEFCKVWHGSEDQGCEQSYQAVGKEECTDMKEWAFQGQRVGLSGKVAQHQA